jgi:PAS domain S-box-containing protein
MVNQKGTRVLGYPEPEIVGANFYEKFVPEDFRDSVKARFEQASQYGYSESPIKPKDGPERLIAWHTIPLTGGNDDSTSGILISGADVTQVRNLEAQLRDAQKMEALGTLARGVAHDFNNILSSVLGYAELSLAEVHDPRKVAEYLSKLETSVDRARELIRGILTFARGNAQVRRPIDVADAVGEALQLLKPTLGANIRLREVLERGCGAVLADPTQLVQVVLNLCTNAAQAMGESGGTIDIHVRGVTLDIEKARSTALLEPGPHVQMTIADDGPGMDDFTLSRVFDPFFTTRRRDEGTGLGLAVVHGIVTQLQGAIEVTSSPAAGSRFDIYLPCSAEPAIEPELETGGHTGVLTGSESVLIVDDEPSVREIVDEALTRLGYHVLTAESGEQALELLDRLDYAVDLVVTDQTLPGMPGHQLAQRIRGRRADLPILLTSGSGHPDSAAIDLYIDKPFTPSTLIQAMRSVLTRVS